jgi:hypothetical protein
MAKIKINKLPEGYIVRDGKVVKAFYHGGSNYMPGMGGMQMPVQTSVTKNTIGPVPRDMANLEAEKGETVLTDLNNDNSMELYNISGKRHTEGGTPLSLPEQSFIYSDTAKMRLNTSELAELGINSKKKMTPAAVSKKYQLNKYIGLLDENFFDPITEKTADLMLQKNKMKLSQLAFIQERKKDFEEGVPLASYPYLVSQEIDPIEFSMKVEDLNRQQAELKMIDQLPADQREQVLAMRDFMQQAQQMPQQMVAAQQATQGQNPMMGMAQGMMNMAQDGNAEDKGYELAPMGPSYDSLSTLEKANYAFSPGMYEQSLRTNKLQAPDSFIPGAVGKVYDAIKMGKSIYDKVNDYFSNPGDKAEDSINELQQTNPATFGRFGVEMGGSYPGMQMTMENGLPIFQGDEGSSEVDREVVEGSTKRTESSDPDIMRKLILKDPNGSLTIDNFKDEYKDAFEEMYNNTINLDPNALPSWISKENLERTKIKDTYTSFDKWADEFFGFNRQLKVIEKHLDKLPGYNADKHSSYEEYLGDPEIQKNLNSSRGEFSFDDLTKLAYEAEGLDPATAVAQGSDAVGRYQTTYNIYNDMQRNTDSPYGQALSNLPIQPQGFNPDEENPNVSAVDFFAGSATAGQTRGAINVTEETIPEEGEEIDDQIERDNITTVDTDGYTPFWMQDQMNINQAIANKNAINRYDPIKLSYDPEQIDLVFKDPTREIAAIGEQADLAGRGAMAFAGPKKAQAILSRAQGIAGTQIADTLARVQDYNINTANQGEKINAQARWNAQVLNNNALKSFIDETNTANQNFDNAMIAANTQINKQIANAYTNAANTYNMNTLYDQFNINPGQAGIINFTGATQDIAGTQPGANYMDNLDEAYKQAKVNDPDLSYKDFADVYMKTNPQSSSTSSRDQLAALINQGGYGGNQVNGEDTGKRGKEMKKKKKKKRRYYYY